MSTELNSVVWYQRFGQTINSYADARYDAIQSRQVDRDRTWGIREFFKHRSGPIVFAGSFNFLESTHRQRDIKYRDGRPPAVLPDRLLYKQRNWSVGGEVEYDLSANLKAEIGLGYDVVDYVRTGDKPPVKKAQDWTGRAGLVFDPGDGWRLRGALGRKMRAPTMRERFGEDINRFMPNYDLKPEQILTAEIGVEWRGESGGFYVIPFIQDLDNTIDQRIVNALRQRINLKGFTVKAVEMGVRLERRLSPRTGEPALHGRHCRFLTWPTEERLAPNIGTDETQRAAWCAFHTTAGRPVPLWTQFSSRSEHG